MMNRTGKGPCYFPYDIQIRGDLWGLLELDDAAREVEERGMPRIMFFRRLAERLSHYSGQPVQAGLLNLYALYMKALRHLTDVHTEERKPALLEEALATAGFPCGSPELARLLEGFGDCFPCGDLLNGTVPDPAAWLAGDTPGHGRKKLGVKELLLLRAAIENPALTTFRVMLDDSELEARSAYRTAVAALERELAKGGPVAPFALSLPELLRAPAKASPHSLEGQMEYIRSRWADVLPPELVAELTTAFAVLAEEGQMFAPRGEPGGANVLEFLKGGRLGKEGYDYPEYERFSPDADWMANVVMLAKMTYVWLDQLSRKYQRPIHRLDQVPDEELDLLARWGFTSLWLIGLWERSPASQKIKQIAGNPDAISSAYSLYDYIIAHDLGGEEALGNLKERCRQRGIRLASDMVPNHTGLYSRWTVEHPDWFVQLDYPPYPAYTFNGPDLSFSPEISLHIEDGYWERRDAAVVFKHHDHRDGRTRYIYHGNDGTSTPWNDTAQLNYLIPEVREAVIRTIIHVARQFPVIRFDAAMTLAKKHYQRLWYPQPGSSGVPSRAEHGMGREEFDAVFPEEFWRQVVDRVAAEAPDTLLLAEAFWLMEGYFVRTLGMHRVYNSAFMNMLKLEENAKYRQTIKNVLEYDHRILQRFVNFMNNPDEKTAVEQFGKEGKYFGACVLLVTMPGLPMIGHGQVEGFHEKYGMEYRRAYWDEPVDEHLVKLHERMIFPLMRRRWLFSGSENFVLYDFFADGQVDENVYAYSNRAGDERGLVIYNNRYGDAAGWLRTSTSRGVKNAQDETVLVQTTLAEALGFDPDGRSYYTWRDSVSGLHYLRSGRELCEQGLFVELSAYECRAYLDFTAIRDDEYGTWGRLCFELAGRPVASLDEEVKQIRHAEVNVAFREVCGELDRHLADPPALRENLAALEPALESLFELINRHTLCQGDGEAVAAETLTSLEVVERLILLQKDEKLTLPMVVLDLPADRLMVAGWLALHRAGRLAETADVAATAASWCDELGLLRPFADLFRFAQAAAGAPIPMDESAAGSLLLALLRRPSFFAGAETSTAPEQFRQLFADPTAREFLDCHWSGDAEWFVKERFEILLGWLLLASVVTEGGAAPDSLATIVPPLASACQSYYLTAARAGYRTDRFLALLAGEELPTGVDPVAS
ncbi:alpha-amylase family glycosyl hydrolase [Geobacter sp. AOG1]|uniref:alpha-amylase family glycosyl hydrolase n=1 Tax=Geobacter sp. AOG1 TaxID=1566346 RepID=UPI001CC4D40D|nr:alpha-amylase family glycosyl hydrolase [Geobacter sp. AOG1]